MNCIITAINDQLVTTTLAIADGTRNDHSSVIKLVRTYQMDLQEFGLLDFKSESSGGRPTEYAELNEQQSTLLLAYMRNTEIIRTFKKRLVKEFWEMRNQQVTTPAFSIPQTLTEALRLAADLSEQKEVMAKQLAIAAPKVDFADALMNAEGTTLVRDAAKTIGVGVRKLEKALRTKGVILLNNAPAAIYVEKGYFKESTHSFETKTKGVQLGHTARVTGRGIEFLRRFAARHQGLLGGSH